MIIQQLLQHIPHWILTSHLHRGLCLGAARLYRLTLIYIDKQVDLFLAAHGLEVGVAERQQLARLGGSAVWEITASQ